MRAGIARNVERVLCTEEYHTGLATVLADETHTAVLRQTTCHGRPGFPEVRGPITVRRPIAAPVVVDCDVGGPKRSARRGNATDITTVGRTVNMLTNLGPRLPPVARHLHIAIVGADPENLCGQG